MTRCAGITSAANDKFTDNGFKRLINQGYSCNNCLINYIPTITDIGHTSVLPTTISSCRTTNWLPAAHIPYLFFSWRVSHGATSREVHITDIAPTVCQLLHIQQPDACTGEPIIEITK